MTSTGSQRSYKISGFLLLSLLLVLFGFGVVYGSHWFAAYLGMSMACDFRVSESESEGRPPPRAKSDGILCSQKS